MLTMKKALIGTSLAAIALSAVVLASDNRRPKGVATGASRLFAGDVKAFPARPAPPKPTWVGWKVEVDPGVQSKQGEYHLALAKVLSHMDFVPNERVAHFREIDTPQYRLDGWHGFIASASPTPNGSVVDLRVTPRVTSSNGASTTVIGGVIERYEVTDGGARYLGSAAPPGGFFHGVITD